LRIPDSFKQAIKDTFYDKEVITYTTEEVVDDEGWARLSESELSSFSGNVRFDNLGQLQEDYGLKEVIDIVITTDEDIEVGTVLKYGDVLYKVSKAIPFDSHNLLVGNIWSSKSSDSISA